MPLTKAWRLYPNSLYSASCQELVFSEAPIQVSESLCVRTGAEGHASVKQTADTYTHVSPNMHREAAMRLDDFLSKHLKWAPVVVTIVVDAALYAWSRK